MLARLLLPLRCLSHLGKPGVIIPSYELLRLGTIKCLNCQTSFFGNTTTLTSGKISFASPLAKSLIGKFEGDLTKVETPSGVVEYEIEKVDYV